LAYLKLFVEAHAKNILKLMMANERTDLTTHHSLNAGSYMRLKPNV
jgi:hypothetical protein